MIRQGDVVRVWGRVEDGRVMLASSVTDQLVIMHDGEDSPTMYTFGDVVAHHGERES